MIVKILLISYHILGTADIGSPYIPYLIELTLGSKFLALSKFIG